MTHSEAFEKAYPMSTLAAKLRSQGFDRTLVENGVVHISCSQCEATVIQGVACHEHGCPNTR